MIAKASPISNRPAGAVPVFFDFAGPGEPPLAELMADDPVRRMMARDGVEVEQLVRLLDEVRKRLL